MRLFPVLVAALAALSIACGAQTPATPSDSGAEDQPVMGGRLVRWITADPTGADPSIQSVSSVSDRWIIHSYERLLGFKTDKELAWAEMILQPELAESWSISPDAKTFTFKLRQGVRWHNLPPVNGREFTSADVKFSYEYMTRSGEFKDKGLRPAAFAWWFEGMEAVETPDKYTAVVKFKEPFVPFITYSAVDKNVMYAREVYDKHGDFMSLETVVGTGPFIFDYASAQRGTRWAMKKNPNYWQPGKPYLDEVVGIVIPDASTAFAALRTKQIDYLSGSGYTMNPQDIQQLQAMVPDVKVVEYQNINTDNIYMFLHGPPFNNANLRKAVAYAIDRDEFIRIFADGKGEWSLAGGFPDTFTPEERKQILKFDPNESRRLLAQEGYANGLNIEFLGSTAYGQVYKSKAELLQAQLRRVGINMSIQMLDHPDYLRRTRTGGKFDITFRGKALFVDIDSYAYAVFHPNGSTEGGGGPNDPFMTPLLEQSRREVDPAKRRELIRTIVKHANEQAYRLGLYYAASYDAYAPYVRGIADHLQANAQEFLNAWVAR